MSRELWTGIIIGLIVGWIIEWIIDWLYWRKKYQQLLRDCGDDLILINGVGPVIEERLHKAGIYTFEQLADAKAEILRNAIGQAQNLADEQDLINQARKFVQEKSARKSRKGA